MFQAFRYVIIPVMWLDVITTGLFSVLLAYNDFAICAVLLGFENQTMLTKINSLLGTVRERNGRRHVCRRCRGQYSDAAVLTHPVLPATDRSWPDRRR